MTGESREVPPIAPLRPRVIQTDRTDPIPVRQSDVPISLPPPPRSRRTPVRYALGGLVLLILAGFVVDAVRLVQSAFALGQGLGIAAALLLGLGVAGPLVWLLWEWRSLSGLKRLDRLHDLSRAPTREQAVRVAEATLKLLSASPATDDFRGRLQPHHDGEDVLNLARAIVLPPSDEAARQVVRRAVLQTAGLTVLSPTVLIDTLLFVVRAMAMLRAVAQVYGQHPGLAGLRHLLREIVRETATLGAVELGGQMLGEVGGKAVERLGMLTGSVLAAQRMARLGLLAMRVCRPIPFDAAEAPTITQLAGDLLLPTSADRGQGHPPK